MDAPARLEVAARPAPEPGRPSVLFVHGSLDRGDSFRRVVRRLPDITTIRYDRRGYAGSRGSGTTGLEGHVADLLSLAAGSRKGSEGPVVAIGHSFGGAVVLAAALEDPAAFGAVGTYEVPVPWLGFRPAPPSGSAARPGSDPAAEAERVFCASMGRPAWQRLSEARRQAIRDDGPALVADMASLRTGTAPFDVTALAVPAVFAAGGTATAPHHRRAARWLAANVARASHFEITAAGHGAHLSHPDHFAALTHRVLVAAAETATAGGHPAANRRGVAPLRPR